MVAPSGIFCSNNRSAATKRRARFSCRLFEYRDGIEGRRGADHIQLRLRYNGPFDLGLFRLSSFATSNISWSHAFADRLSGVLTVSEPFGSPSLRTTFLSGDVVSRQVDQVAGPRITFSLTYSLGPPTRR
ncbi:MAG TPA: hypothetical protein VEW71_01120 [Allosphingosinicella sp.]|nr:hypothetical protein [Allosphingosinicella sp.]